MSQRMSQTRTQPAHAFRRSLRHAVMGLLAATTLAAGCKKAVDAPEAVVVSVQAEKAEVKPITEYVQADTVLSPRAQAAIVPKISAPVERFLVQRGANVHKGQLLAVLQNADLAASPLLNKQA